MVTTQVSHFLCKEVLIERLAAMAASWREAASADGDDGLTLPVDIGLLLWDLCDMMELDLDQRVQILGKDLADEISAVVDTPLEIDLA